jgi:predicted CXXCH cytochrome family protein
MSQLECYDCHHPHRILTVESKDCLGECHGPEVRAGVHGKHLAVTSLTCLDCHKPHTWVVRKEGAKGLCDRCHEYRDPATFIY